MNKQQKIGTKLIDYLLQKTGAKNDAALAKLLGLGAPHISKIRSGQNPVTPFTILRIHDVLDMSIAEIKSFLPPAPKAKTIAKPKQSVIVKRTLRS